MNNQNLDSFGKIKDLEVPKDASLHDFNNFKSLISPTKKEREDISDIYLQLICALYEISLTIKSGTDPKNYEELIGNYRLNYFRNSSKNFEQYLILNQEASQELLYLLNIVLGRITNLRDKKLELATKKMLDDAVIERSFAGEILERTNLKGLAEAITYILDIVRRKETFQDKYMLSDSELNLLNTALSEEGFTVEEMRNKLAPLIRGILMSKPWVYSGMELQLTLSVLETLKNRIENAVDSDFLMREIRDGLKQLSKTEVSKSLNINASDVEFVLSFLKKILGDV
jgi:hypothetical protein